MSNKVEEATKKVTDRIIAQMKDGNLPPWSSGRSMVMSRPYNVASKRPYKGINYFITNNNGYAYNAWGTFKNWSNLDTYIRKDEKATAVVCWKRKVFTKNVKDANGEIVEKERVWWSIYLHNVFNISQTAMTQEEIVEFLKLNPSVDTTEYPEADAVAVNYLEKSGVSFKHDNQTPCYIPSTDTISMPHKNVYETADNYLSTLFHEEAHSTGASTRLNRDLTSKFGTGSYGFEELVAEMTAGILCSMLGVVNSKLIDNTGAYIKNWLESLENNPEWVLKASSKAQKAVEHILGS